MLELSLVTLTGFLLLFLRNPQFSGSSSFKAELEKLPLLRNVTAFCCSKKSTFSKVVNFTLNLDCGKYFGNASCFIELRADNTQLKQLKVSKPKKYSVEFIKSLRKLRFKYTKPTNGKSWKLTVHTAKNSTDPVGRVYFDMNCYKPGSITIPLANSFDNFKPGTTDIFDFEAPEFTQWQYCVSIYNSLFEKWIITSFTLTNHNNVNYTFYHGESTYYHEYYGYRSTHNAVNWTFIVTTGSVGTIYSVDIKLINGNCNSRLTLDSKFDDFQPNSIDVFHMPAKNCKGLEKIQIRSQEYNAKWIFVQLNATQEDGTSYIFHHNESLSHVQTFFVNQTTGDRKWIVSVCSNTSTDYEVYLTLYCRHGKTDNLRLSTPDDDFQAGQCSNFTLFLKDIGKLWKIEIKKSEEFQINTLTLDNGGKTCTFYPPAYKKSTFQLVYPEMGVRIFKPDIKKAEEKENECAVRCVNDKACQHFSVVNNNCNFYPSTHSRSLHTIYTLRHEITVFSTEN